MTALLVDGFVTLTNNPEKDGLDGYYEISFACHPNPKVRWKYHYHITRFIKRYGDYPKSIEITPRLEIGRYENVRLIETL